MGPATVALQENRNDLVAGLAQPVGHGCPGLHGDLVLARASPDEDSDSHQGVVDPPPVPPPPVVVVVVVVLCCSNFPTEIATASPFGSLLPPCGDWLITMPSEFGSLVVCMTTRALNPAACRSLIAASFDSPTTLGTTTEPTPFETTIVTESPLCALLPPSGIWSMTCPFGSLDSCCWTRGTRPACRIWPTASPWPRPTTDGT